MDSFLNYKLLPAPLTNFIKKISLQHSKCFTHYNSASHSHFVNSLSLSPGDRQGTRLRGERSTQNHMVHFSGKKDLEPGSSSLHLDHLSLCNDVFTIFFSSSAMSMGKIGQNNIPYSHIHTNMIQPLDYFPLAQLRQTLIWKKFVS